ncbi:MAG: hypothetical protein M3083_13220 [Actinomycetota bacterium]|nr:hypothetical protein [Actinomycetota bacterium]
MTSDMGGPADAATGPIVVGLDGPLGPRQAPSRALHDAEWRATPVRALHAHAASPGASVGPTVGAAASDGSGRQHTSVVIEREAVTESPGAAFVERRLTRRLASWSHTAAMSRRGRPFGEQVPRLRRLPATVMR